jgi:hypothetical protein
MTNDLVIRGKYHDGISLSIRIEKIDRENGGFNSLRSGFYSARHTSVIVPIGFGGASPSDLEDGTLEFFLHCQQTTSA